MPDDLTKTGASDRNKVNVNQAHELRDWSKKFGVTEQQLKDAVKAVGVSADAVKKHLGK
ncbi:DUF3606 domain-containing protein [Pseudomonas syringae pv. pisi str. PP1]|jgi:hypothetical protein|uniref:DUF3606 domain-containing protein n=1 Tax=Pseudomonas syringae TaxID=317 RepID=UPI0003F7401A|nr:DUF3606 domain-containing protein [Pseudomonas syringae]AZG86080.1 DUF3606 domain-containing protein [Pseudomonas syringae pv. pisi str. PP1]MEE4740612.1 DUF3606 domain-containing protein [Pseudomonas alliivorans]RMM23404.1 hypothetical protein ALQ81_03282 [Pseudomonas syringae pv. pisi]UZS64501.1 DUF3606 domain-containing protein [Pseudomonas syringae]